MLAVLAALLAFAVIHSLTAGRFKHWFRARFGERAYHGLYRILYNAFSLLTLAPALLLVVVFRDGGVAWRVDLAWEPLLLAVQAVGLIGYIPALLQIDLLRFAGIKQAFAYLRGDPLPLADEPLQTGGVYGVVRHPLYFFSLLVIWPVTTMTWAYLGFCIGATLYMGVGSLLEERRMQAAFGAEYAAYQRRVPWLIPFVRLPRQRGT